MKLQLKADLQEVNEAINGLERQIHEQAEAAQPLQNKKKEIADAIKENRQRLQDIQVHFYFLFNTSIKPWCILFP